MAKGEESVVTVYRTTGGHLIEIVAIEGYGAAVQVEFRIKYRDQEESYKVGWHDSEGAFFVEVGNEMIVRPQSEKSLLVEEARWDR